MTTISACQPNDVGPSPQATDKKLPLLKSSRRLILPAHALCCHYKDLDFGRGIELQMSLGHHTSGAKPLFDSSKSNRFNEVVGMCVEVADREHLSRRGQRREW